MKGKIVLVHFPFTNLTAAKLRPVLVIHEGDQNVAVAIISSRTPAHLSAADLRVPADHPAFHDTGLKVSSIIKIDKIATISKDLIEGEIGSIPTDLAVQGNTIVNQVFHL